MSIGSVGQGPQQVPQKEWTVLYYIDGKNNLAPMMQHEFDEIDKVGSDDNVNLVAQFAMPKKDTMQGLMTGKGTAEFENMGSVDMGSGDNVQKFVEWGMKNFPAKHYALVMSDHGAGFKGSMVDEETHHLINNNQLASALEAAQKTTGKKLDVLDWNACLMNMGETAYELRNSTDFMVGSEETEAGMRIPIPHVTGTTPQNIVAQDLKAGVKQKGSVSGEDLAKLYVFESKSQFGASMYTPTQSALDLSKAEALRASAEKLAGVLNGEMAKDPTLIDVLRKDITKTQHFLAADMYIKPYDDYRDMGDFAKNIERETRFTNPGVAQAAREMQQAVQDIVISEFHAPVSGFGGRSLEGANGISVYLPRNYGFDPQGHSSIDNVPTGGTQGHENTSWGKDSNWDAMLKTIAKDKDILAKYPNLNRKLENAGQILGFEGYNQAYDILRGATAATKWSIFPLQGFPYLLPLPGPVTAGMGILGGALRLEKGGEKLHEGFVRTDSPSSHRTKLLADGAIDAAIGGTSIASCGMLLAGMGHAAIPLAAVSLGLGVARMAYNVIAGLHKSHSAAKLDIQAKIDAMANTRPQFPSLNNSQPAETKA